MPRPAFVGGGGEIQRQVFAMVPRDGAQLRMRVLPNGDHSEGKSRHFALGVELQAARCRDAAGHGHDVGNCLPFDLLQPVMVT